MLNAAYLYVGPNSSVTLRVGDDMCDFNDLDVILWSGQQVSLPAEHEITLALLNQGFLKLLD